eukprot:Blabericola_migrator_1__7552@NODE_385_length_9127_cov_126_586424_g308_i0_p9_GENE_NODE_385_length_9127_cov_126_586424_g308_i0NODE_385_length_9127_cov_126_586424_g308_i0_p9_ORF_typecomplete_len102_score10_28_NODE_385_length_9127_cov_126_586424_g308_i073247629
MTRIFTSCRIYGAGVDTLKAMTIDTHHQWHLVIITQISHQVFADVLINTPDLSASTTVLKSFFKDGCDTSTTCNCHHFISPSIPIPESRQKVRGIKAIWNH